PLLREAGGEVNQARITVARNDQRVSVLDFRKTLEDNTAEIEKSYWLLVQAEREVRIQEDLLDRTVRMAGVLYDQRESGNKGVTRVHTSQAAAATYTREATLISARARVLDISTDLKRRMNDPRIPVSGPAIILPGSPATQEAVHFDLRDQIDTAMENRLELGQ